MTHMIMTRMMRMTVFMLVAIQRTTTMRITSAYHMTFLGRSSYKNCSHTHQFIQDLQLMRQRSLVRIWWRRLSMSLENNP